MVSTIPTTTLDVQLANLFKTASSDIIKDSILKMKAKSLIQKQKRVTAQIIGKTKQVIFEEGKKHLTESNGKKILEWVQELNEMVDSNLTKPIPLIEDCMFFPSKANLNRVCGYLKRAKKSLQVCVFNITADELAQELMNAFDRKVDVKVITDDMSIENSQGNDAVKLAKHGISVVTDANPQYHMHNKFVIIDNELVLTGSFNWTVQASFHNQENVVVLSTPYFVEKFQTEFLKLWNAFNTNKVKGPGMTEHQAAVKIQNHYRKKTTYKKK